MTELNVRIKAAVSEATQEMFLGHALTHVVAVIDKIKSVRGDWQFYMTNAAQLGKIWDELRKNNAELHTFLSGSQVFHMELAGIDHTVLAAALARSLCQFVQGGVVEKVDGDKATLCQPMVDLMIQERWACFLVAMVFNLRVIAPVLEPLIPKSGKGPKE